MATRGDAPYGFAPADTILSKRWYPAGLAASITKNIYKNDPVRPNNTGGLIRVIGKAVTELLSGGKILGTALAFADSNWVPLNYMASGGSGYILATTDPNQLYHAQEDCASTCIALADRGLNANMVFTHRGNTTTGVSKAEIDSSTKGASGNCQFIIVNEYTDDDTVGTQQALSYKRWIVRNNQPWHGQDVMGIA